MRSRRALPNGLPPGEAKPKGGQIVDMLRAVPMRAYLALGSLRDGEEGQGMVEYALIIFLVSVVSIAVLTLLGHRVSSVFNEIVKDI
jgi:pilus assembly protein Flp/PilA